MWDQQSVKMQGTTTGNTMNVVIFYATNIHANSNSAIAIAPLVKDVVTALIVDTVSHVILMVVHMIALV